VKGRVDLIVVCVAAAIIGLLAFGRQSALDALPHSTYSTNDTGPNGYQALYNVLHASGVGVSRFSRVLGVLDPSVGTLVISTYAIDPLDSRKAMDSHDKASLKEFVERGGRLVVLDDDFEAENDIIPGVALSQHATAPAAIPIARDRYTAGVRSIAAPIDAAFPFTTHTGVPLLANDAGIVALAYPLGKGTIIAITAPQLFSNAHIASADNARFAYDVISGHGPVAFDEYVHGFDDDLSFWAALPKPVQASVWIVGAIVLIGLLGANVPFAPSVPLDPPEERDSSAYINAMAALMRKARAARAAIETFAADAARRQRGGDAAQAARDRIERLRAIPHPSDAALVEAADLDYRLRKDLT
jgi:Domain of unknown function (DUF4350)